MPFAFPLIIFLQKQQFSPDMSKKVVSLGLLQREQKEADNARPVFISRKKRRQLDEAKLETKPAGNGRGSGAEKTRFQKTVSRHQLGWSSKGSTNWAVNGTINGIESTQALPANKLTSSISDPRKKRQKFNFDWDAAEDTLGDYEVLVERDDGLESGPNLNGEYVHWTTKPLAEMTERDWRIVREDYGIVCKGSGSIPPPLRSWTESGIAEPVVEVLTQILRLKEPTPIQRAAIPVAVASRDVLGIAETGSGKTLSFLVPFFSYLCKDYGIGQGDSRSRAVSNRTKGLVLAPTRELALQITDQARAFAAKFQVNVVPVIGGREYEETVNSIDLKGVDLVVATPGRLVDVVEKGIVSLQECRFLVLDEADRMVDMGFEKLLLQIMDMLPKQVGSFPFSLAEANKRLLILMFTATMTPAIENIAHGYLEEPARLVIRGVGQAVDRINQRFQYESSSSSTGSDGDMELDPQRLAAFVRAIKDHTRNRHASIIVFANFKKTCEALAELLEKHGHRDTVVIHGSKSQEAREAALSSFRDGTSRILVATDVAARGIDIPDVTLVVNFQMPRKFDEYIHRIGRTGRAGKHGESLAFVDGKDEPLFGELRRFLAKALLQIPKWLQELS